jgi:hypothetical protein
MAIAAIERGVGTQMMTYRVNSTGARRQAEASRRRRSVMLSRTAPSSNSAATRTATSDASCIAIG